jgi:mRNA interferase HigB
MRRFAVRVISRGKIREASSAHPEWAASLRTWYKIVNNSSTDWEHFGDVKRTWRNSDSVGICVVFDISNNRCRLVVYINYRSHKVFILHILSHSEYGKEHWKNDCECD